MAKIKRLEQIKRGRDARRWARRHGAEVTNGGRHALATNKRGRCAIPRGELATGTRRAIIKTFIAMGLGLLLLIANAPPWLCDFITGAVN